MLSRLHRHWPIFIVLIGPIFLAARVKACTQPPGYGFVLGYTFETYVDNVLETQMGTKGINLKGDFVDAYDATTRGVTYEYNQTTFGIGIDEVSEADFYGAATPAYWTITPTNGPCAYNAIQNEALFRPSNERVRSTCQYYVHGSVTFTPSIIDTSQDFPTLNIQTDNLDNTYGDPMVAVY